MHVLNGRKCRALDTGVGVGENHGWTWADWETLLSTLSDEVKGGLQAFKGAWQEPSERAETSWKLYTVECN